LPDILPGFNQIWTILTGFHTGFHIPDFKEIRLVGALLMHADKRTDGHDESNKRFS
jgi:hypothetical protein